jgi:tricorn protease
MKIFRTFLVAAFTLLIAPLNFIHAGSDQEPIRFARTPDISPDGEKIAFSYLGDIWIVDRIGGIARPVTLHEAHDFMPIFSPDGRWLAFSSNRHGSYDVFVVPVRGGKPRRLTFDSASDIVTGWSPDGKSILFSSNRSPDYPGGFELYSVPFEGGRERRISFGDGKEGVYSPAGDQIAYVRGQGLWYRKGYRGSSNDDIWLCSADGNNNRRLTTFNGQDSSPMWSQDGQWIYYVSEESTTPTNAPPSANVLRRDAAGKSQPQQITFHKDDGVRRARISAKADADGRQWIVYECGPDLWVVSPQGGEPRKLAIEIHADDKVNTEKTITFTQGASEFALSADEKHVAFAVHGEIFMMPITGGKAMRLTESPAYDHGIAWSPDSKKIIFTSDRSGQEDLYLLEADDPEHKDFVSSHKFKVRQLTNSPEPEIGVNFSPDGKRVAFLRAGKLWTMNPDGTNQKIIVNDLEVIDYDWSPDSKWFVFARQDGSFASELYIIPAEPGASATGANQARNVTHYATYNGNVTWSGRRDRPISGSNGNKIAFVSQRHDTSGMYVLSLQRPATPGAPESKEIDWDDIYLRVERAAPIPVEDGAISPDGNRIAFCSSGSSSNDLWVAASNGSQLTRLTTGNVHPQQIQWSQKQPDLIYYRDRQGQICSARATSWSPGGPPTMTDIRSAMSDLRAGRTGAATGVIEFKAKMTVRRDEEFREMFEQSWRALREHFYDPAFHGANWEAVRAKYRPLVQHVALREDLYALMSLMMGELNASHLGILGFSSSPEETTADLGLIFDDSFHGPGLKIAEILKQGPADRRGIALKPGDIIRSIDHVEFTDQVSLSQLLNDKIGETLALQVTANPSADMKDPKAFRKVEIQPVNRHQIHDLMYERWIDHNAKRVAELSGGKLGYIHIPSMDEAGLDRFVRALYSDSFDKEGVVLDVRFNGGGFTHDQILNYLGAREHTTFRQRDGGQGVVLRRNDRKWTKPLVVLINNRSYSDAEIFPSAVRTLGLGKLVGQSTGGHVIGTSSVRLIDGTMFRIPRTGVFTLKGVNMEREGVTPDVEVEDLPDQLAKGIDAQLDKSVEVLKTDVIVWKQTHSNLAAGPVIQPEGRTAKPTTQAASPMTVPTAPMVTPPPEKKQ